MSRIQQRSSGYDPEAVDVGIVHLGLGAFHRAHQAVYIERWLNRNNGGEWGICAANIRSNSTLVDSLRAQGYRYHVAEFADGETATISEINSIREALFARDHQQELLERMTAPATRIVSLTVTEKGYYLNPATGDLLRADPAIAFDLQNPQAPRTAPGLVLEALRRRRILGIAPFTVLSCDNMPENGMRTRRAVVALAAAASEDLASWLEAEVDFPSSMVDRIVPAVSASMAKRLEAIMGFRDPAAVGCEAFSQWVIEDSFSAGRPDWEADGVQMVADVRPFETAKLRLLNGAHSLLAYAGLLRGKRTVAEAIGDTGLASMVDAFFDEASDSLTAGQGLSPGFDLARYRASILRRFRNDALEHSLKQIATDGSQKIPQRWLEGAMANLADDCEISATAMAVAAWMVYVRGRDRDGNTWRVDDPLAERLSACHRRGSSSDEIVDALFGIRDIFPEPLGSHQAFRRGVLHAFRELSGEA